MQYLEVAICTPKLNNQPHDTSIVVASEFNNPSMCASLRILSLVASIIPKWSVMSVTYLDSLVVTLVFKDSQDPKIIPYCTSSPLYLGPQNPQQDSVCSTP